LLLPTPAKINRLQAFHMDMMSNVMPSPM